MKKYSQKTLPIQVGKLKHKCPLCELSYMIHVKTSNGAIYYHNANYSCVVKA